MRYLAPRKLPLTYTGLRPSLEGEAASEMIFPDWIEDFDKLLLMAWLINCKKKLIGRLYSWTEDEHNIIEGGGNTCPEEWRQSCLEVLSRTSVGPRYPMGGRHSWLGHMVICDQA